MADDIKFPTWHDVGIPDHLVQSMRRLCHEQAIEGLVFDKVFHYNRRMQYTYVCGVCGYVHRAEKSYEDYSTCQKCESRGVHATQSVRQWGRTHPNGCSQMDEFGREVLSKMRENYLLYFGGRGGDFAPEDILSFHWRYDAVVARFVGGEEADDRITTRAVCKAAIMTPFLWDNSFDWKNHCKRSPNRRIALVPTLYEFRRRGQ